MTHPTLISVDFALIARCSGALLWGVLVALFLETRYGTFIAERRTWISVVAGVGGDLLIAYDGDWWTVTLVIAVSSLGVITRSLIHEQHESEELGRYRRIWLLEDLIGYSRDLIAQIEAAMTEQAIDRRTAVLSKALTLAHRINEVVRAARRGEYEQRGTK